MNREFRIPAFFRITCLVMSVVMLAMTGYAISQINESPLFIFITFACLLLAWSMFAYTRLKLTFSETSLDFTGGWFPHHAPWNEIHKIEMTEVGKFMEPQVTLFYGDKKLTITRSMFLKRQYKEILLLLEQRLSPHLFTAQYQQIRRKVMRP
ncbi:hypothetical protein FHW36_103203 [Chitinophaga polysaccharea]|uniref:PH (Pleckstrin Homology) domain-containing protein n=1 Tax=Chitinophaga polysaccharea TaxID=1293035 RepID=A0A561PTD8_9BACT|nr:hypothetical protein [Chitinophaga polysaccharea]TWF41399.1 hypothetical protein FHW36_103203 [Chitinophaga polysaccharea]